MLHPALFSSVCTVRRPPPKLLLGQRAGLLHAELDIEIVSWGFLAHQRDLPRWQRRGRLVRGVITNGKKTGCVGVRFTR